MITINMSKYTKIILAITAIIFLVPSLWAQKRQKPSSYVSFAGGVSIPFGDFGNKIKGEDYTGYAMLGMSYKMRLGIPLGGSGLGIGLGITMNIHPRDAQAIAENVAKALPNYHVKIASNSYTNYVSHVGIFGAYPIGDKFFFDNWFGFEGGTAIFPSTTIEIIGNRSDYTTTKTETGYTVGFGGGIGGRYAFAERVGLILQLDYSYQYANWDAISGSQTQQMLNITTGIYINIGR